MLPADDTPLLSATGISKHFGGLAALSDVSITVRRGEICGLIGPNGAGKTTLFNILTGIYAPDAGELMFDGMRLTGLKPHRVAACGIARTFQNIRLFGSMTALENVMVGRHVRTRAGVLGAVFRTRKTVTELLNKYRALWARANQTHFSSYHIDELRHFIKPPFS